MAFESWIEPGFRRVLAQHYYVAIHTSWCENTSAATAAKFFVISRVARSRYDFQNYAPCQSCRLFATIRTFAGVSTQVVEQFVSTCGNLRSKCCSSARPYDIKNFPSVFRRRCTIMIIWLLPAESECTSEAMTAIFMFCSTEAERSVSLQSALLRLRAQMGTPGARGSSWRSAVV